MFLIYTISGIVLGSVYALTAVGYSIVYGVLELVNFAHGTIFMVGAYLMYILCTLLGVPLLPGAVIAVALTGAVGILYERIALRPLRLRNLPKFCFLICTIGISIVLENILFVTMGSEARLYPTLREGTYYSVLGVNLSFVQLLIMLVAVVLMAALVIFLKKSPLGMAMRATAQNRTATELMGISVDAIVSITFFLGSALAAVSGIFYCMAFRSVSTGIGAQITQKTSASTVLGGIGEIGGAVIGGLILGLTESYTSGYIGSEYRDVAAFIVLIAVLLIRPSGLLGKPAQKKV